ncbi:MAG TPA: hypothetical protein VFZ67_04570 [Nitrososphaera sp.]
MLNATSFSSSYRTSIYIGSFGGGAVVDTKERRAQRDSREKPSELRHNSTKSGFFSGTQKDVNIRRTKWGIEKFDITLNKVEHDYEVGVGSYNETRDKEEE